MYIIEVIPISRGITKETLTYFSAQEIVPGSIVQVLMRKRPIPALVVTVNEAVKEKLDIRSGDFALKKVSKVLAHSFLSPAFLKSASATADYFASTTGAVISTTVPKFVFDDMKKIQPRQKPDSNGVNLEQAPLPANTSQNEKLALQASDEERLGHYKSLIREEFARKKSVFFCLPTIEDIRHMKTALEKGIDAYTFVLHSKLSTKELLTTWNTILKTEHPVLIVATAQFLSLNRADIKTIIVDKESSRHYKSPTRPYLDMRIFAERYAHEAQAKFVVGDLLLRTETIYGIRTDEFTPLFPIKMRSVSHSEATLVDMHTIPDRNGKNGNGRKVVSKSDEEFRIFSTELEEVIRRTKENNEHLYLFGARKGFATEIVCADCNEIVRCTNCGAPVILHSLNVKENYLFCNKCGEKRNAAERCKRCTGWNLTSLGVGVERIEAHLHHRFPDIKTFRLDKDSVPTEKKALELVAKFLATPGSILIGTELALIYLKESIENTAIVSIDSLFAVPDFRISEKLFHIILEVRGLSKQRFILQTRNADEDIYKLAMQGNLLDFYRTEIADRERFGYPPFGIFIKITLEGTRARVEKEMDKLKEYLKPFEADFFPAFDIPGIKKFSMNALLKVSSKDFPQQDLLQKLRTLPPHYRIKVDPDTLL